MSVRRTGSTRRGIRLAHITAKGIALGGGDLEVPAELPVVELSRLIAAALKLDSDPFGRALRHEVFAVPPGRLLAGGETLASAAVWDGATLTLTPFGKLLKRDLRELEQEGDALLRFVEPEATTRDVVVQ